VRQDLEEDAGGIPEGKEGICEEEYPYDST